MARRSSARGDLPAWITLREAALLTGESLEALQRRAAAGQIELGPGLEGQRDPRFLLVRTADVARARPSPSPRRVKRSPHPSAGSRGGRVLRPGGGTFSFGAEEVTRRDFIQRVSRGAAVLGGAISGLQLLGISPVSAVDREVTGLQSGGFTVPAGETWEIKGLVRSDASVVVLGKLVMRPGATLRFIDVNESRFQGGGVDFLGRDAGKVQTDVGLWVLGDGVLDAAGTRKTGWADDPSQAVGWLGSDDVRSTPSAPGDSTSFPKDDRGPEVFNLTRDVVIEGTPGGRAHTLIRSSRPQTITHVAFRQMGATGVLGRYPLHFHHAEDSSRGSLVEGCVTESCGNHAFVPHTSHGVTMRDCVAFDTIEDPFWWDEGDPTNDLLWEHCLAALVHPTVTFRGFRLSAYRLGQGTNVALRDSVAVGVQGNVDASGFHWGESGSGIWDFRNNLAHNNRVHGIFVWQNTSRPHFIEDTVLYSNGGTAIDHGAYSNNYRYSRVSVRDTGIEIQALSRDDGSDRQTWERVTVQTPGPAVTFKKHAVDTSPVLFLGCVLNGSPRVLVDDAGGNPTKADFVDCGVLPSDIVWQDATKGGAIRIQEGGEAWLVTPGGVRRIEPFHEGTTEPSPSPEPSPEPTPPPEPSPSPEPSPAPTPVPDPADRILELLEQMSEGERRSFLHKLLHDLLEPGGLF